MTLDEVKSLKSGQEIYYLGLELLPEKVIVDKILQLNGNFEIHLIDNCYIPERDLNYIFLTFDECAKTCENLFKIKLEKLRKLALEK